MDERIIALIDKTILRITGLRVGGLRPPDVEACLADRLGTPVRVIGVTGESLQLDVYGLVPEQIQRDAEGLLKALSAVEGITVTDVVRMASAPMAVDVDMDRLPRSPLAGGCRAERWRIRGPTANSHHHPDGR